MNTTKNSTYQLLHSKLMEYVHLTDEEFELCSGLFTYKKLRKKQYFLQEGDVCKHQAFVVKGLTRTYRIDDKGTEYILQFAMEGWWMADLYSFFTEEPSIYNTEALEDCELLLLSKVGWNLLLDKIPAFEKFFRILLQNNLIATQRRLMGSLSESAEKKYLKLIATYPTCVQRVPQHMIASYLGITRETLSRVRAHLAAK